jgi:hypothetical protein
MQSSSGVTTSAAVLVREPQMITSFEDRWSGTKVARLWRRLRDRWETSWAYQRLTPAREGRAFARWHRAGRPVPPPPAVKRALIAHYAAESGLRTLVETGTFVGGTVASMLRRFDRIVSMELSEEMADRARRRFAKYRHVTILRGDSSQLLPDVLVALDAPALFWLDAHYSEGATARGPKETPITEELQCILAANPSNVVLVDDARCFAGQSDYPTLDELRAFVAARRPDLHFEVADDVIRLTPPGIRPN